MVYLANTPNGSTMIVIAGGRQQIPVFLQVDPVQYVKVTEIIIIIDFAVTSVTVPLVLNLSSRVVDTIVQILTREIVLLTHRKHVILNWKKFVLKTRLGYRPPRPQYLWRSQINLCLLGMGLVPQTLSL
jgi:hypothetical protein